MISSANTKLHVMLDTNVLVSQSRFVSSRLSKIIRDPLHATLNISWVIPEMVQLEREYQFRQKLKHVLAAAKDMPAFFANTWVGDAEAMYKEIARVGQTELGELGIVVRQCDPARVDWRKIMSSAGCRLPPFDPNAENEKGFKDAIVAETFEQLCGDLPANGAEIAILVTDDELLLNHVASQNYPNAKVIRGVGALQSELNFLVSDIAPEMFEDLQLKANALIATSVDFWSTVAGLARPWVDLNASNDMAFSSYVTGDRYWAPVFLRKEMAKLLFSCVYSVERTAQRWVAGQPASAQPQMGGLLGLSAAARSATATSPFGQTLTPEAQSIRDLHAHHDFSSIRHYGSPTVGFGPAPVAPPYAGYIETIALPPVNFTVTWSADYAVDAEANGAPILSNPRILEVLPAASV